MWFYQLNYFQVGFEHACHCKEWNQWGGDHKSATPHLLGTHAYTITKFHDQRKPENGEIFNDFYNCDFYLYYTDLCLETRTNIMPNILLVQ